MACPLTTPVRGDNYPPNGGVFSSPCQVLPPAFQPASQRHKKPRRCQSCWWRRGFAPLGWVSASRRRGRRGLENQLSQHRELRCILLGRIQRAILAGHVCDLRIARERSVVAFAVLLLVIASKLGHEGQQRRPHGGSTGKQ